MFGYIYKTTNLINGKIYIGKREKKSFQPGYRGSGKKLKSAIQHYGVENFKTELIEQCSSRDELCKREKFWIKELHSQDPFIGYNISDGGDGGDIYHNLSIEQQQHRNAKQKETIKSRIYEQKFVIHKGSEIKRVVKSQISSYIDNGWLLGPPKWLIEKQQNTKKLRGSNNHTTTWNNNISTAWQNRSQEAQLITKQKHSNATKHQMETYTAEHKHAIAMAGVQARLKNANGRKKYWIHKDGVKKYAYEDELQQYLEDGWLKGMK